MKKTLFALVGVLVIMLVLPLDSCQKQEETVTAASLLRGGKWKLASRKQRYHTVGVDTTYANLLADTANRCVLDDYLTFGEEYKGSYSAGSMLCVPNQSTDIPFSWEVVNINKKLNIEGLPQFFSTDYMQGTITNISPSELIITYTFYMRREMGAAYRTDTFDVTDRFSKF